MQLTWRTFIERSGGISIDTTNVMTFETKVESAVTAVNPVHFQGQDWQTDL